MNKNNPIVLGVTGASGSILGIKTLEFLLKNGYKVELIISKSAYYVIHQELSLEIDNNAEKIKEKVLGYTGLKDNNNLKVWLNDELWANPSSGSYKTSGMIIIPSSMSSIAAIAQGYTENLITRAADVTIKQGRPLIIVPRETPFSSIHLENMLKLSNIGVKIVPPIMGFYGDVRTLDEGLNFIIGKVLDACNIENDLFKRWNYE